MHPEDSILLWKYIDGQCLPEEARQLEQRMTQDADLKAAWELRIRLNQSLRQLPLEQPSLRFALNVMDRLPAMIKKFNIEPLVSPRWLKTFTSTMAMIVCTVLALVSGGEPAAGISSSSPSFSKVSDHFSAIFERLPYNYLLVGATVAFAFILLEAIDRRFAKP